MTKYDKLKVRFSTKPSDFTWSELSKLLISMGYREFTSGKTSGSRVRFVHDSFEPILLHKPHPKPVLKQYQIKQLLIVLKNRGQI